jgi:mannosyltransferase
MLVARSIQVESRPAADNPAAGFARGWIPSGIFVPALAVTIAAVLRLWHLGHQSLWVDEFAALSTALAPLTQIPAQALRNDAFEPPLYFWLLHGVIKAAGVSEWSLRSISAVAGILTVPIIWLLVRDLTGIPRMAHAAALLLAANPLHIWYSQEARPYALLVLLGFSALLCLTRALRGEPVGWWIGCSVLSALAILTHVTAVVFPVVGGLWALHARGARVFRQLALVAAGTFALILPFLIDLVAAVRHAGGTGSPQRPLTGLEVPYTFFTFLGGYSFGPPVREIQDWGWRAAVANHWIETALVIAALLWLTAQVFRVRLAVFQLTVVLVVPLAAVVVGSLLTTKSYNVRYVLPALVGFVGLMAVALGQLSRPAHRLGLGAVLGLFLWADAQWFWSPPYGKDDSRGAARCLIGQLPPGSTVGVAPPYMRKLIEHYAPESAGLRFVGVADSGGLAEIRPAALAVTRLYYLPGLEKELAQAFRGQTRGRSRILQPVGYRLYFASASSNQASEASCQLAFADNR